MTVIPLGLVHVALDGAAAATPERLGARAAAQLRAEVDAAYAAHYLDPGHPRWFFHAFDRDHLDFLIATWEPHPASGGVYRVDRRIRVKRSPAAARALGVDVVIARYEVGDGTLRAGMRPAEVEALRGPPDAVIQLGPVGSFEYVYADACVRFLDGAVALLSPATACH